MIIEMKPVHLGEVKELANKVENKELQDYLKKFAKLSKSDADKMSEELIGLGNLKMKEEQVVKIVDFLPKDGDDLQKIFNDISLDEKETEEILGIVNKYGK